MNESEIKKEVLSTLKKLNDAWTIDKNINMLGEYFHKDIVVIEPGSVKRRIGKEECLEGWKSFIESNQINYWKESGHLVQVYNEGKLAIVTYYWEISCAMDGKDLISKGRDMFVFIKEDGKWLAVADQFSSNPV